MEEEEEEEVSVAAPKTQNHDGGNNHSATPLDPPQKKMEKFPAVKQAVVIWEVGGIEIELES